MPSNKDNVTSTNDWRTWKINGAVKIRESQDKRAPICIHTFIEQSVNLYANHPALVYKENNETITLTYTEYYENVKTVAKAFIKLGLERFRGVSILGGNSSEWMFSHLAASMAGGVASGIYITNSPEACLHCLNISASNLILVENEFQLDKILKVKNQAVHLKKIILISGKSTDPLVLSWNELIKIGKNEPEDKLKQIMSILAPNEVATLLFTSGTIDLPKAVLLSHDNLIFDGVMYSNYMNVRRGAERIISFLPLSHVAALICDIYFPISVGACVYIADKNALKGTLINDMKNVRPTRFLATPRVYEKLEEYLKKFELSKPSYMQYLLNKAKATAFAHQLTLANGQNGTSSLMYKLFNAVIYSKVKATIGLDQCLTISSGAAPLSTSVRDYLAGYDISVGELYGMSESSGFHLISAFYYRGKHTGGSWPDVVNTKIDNPDENGEGEILMYGRNICMGYLNEPEKTCEAIDDEGWLHSGDYGRQTKDRWIEIIGRKKEILITSGGENIPPVLIESNVKKELPIVSQAVLIGEGRKYLTILLTLKSEFNPGNGTPSEELAYETKVWCKSLGCPCTTITEIVEKQPPEIYAEIQRGIDRANAKAISSAQRIQKFKILPRDFSIPTKELGPTTKVVRRVVYSKYKDEIESMYLENKS